MKKNIIAIDGLVATGKGTTAKGVAQTLGYMYMDTGAMYRAAALFLIKNNVDRNNQQQMIDLIKTTDMCYDYNQETDNYDIVLNGKNVEAQIRETSVSSKIPYFTAIKDIREHLIKLIRKASDRIDADGVVVDGRDIGTVIFPDAVLKVFMTCDTEERVQRRYKQLQEQGKEADEQAIRDDIESRDRADYLGPNAANVKAEDARELDTTKLTIEQQVQQIVNWSKEVEKI